MWEIDGNDITDKKCKQAASKRGLASAQFGGDRPKRLRDLKGKHLDFTPRLRESQWLAEHHEISAMMDLSDGLAKDLPRLAKMSGVGFEIEKEDLPLTEGCRVEEALGDGEDYELLLTSSDELDDSWADAFPDLELTRIGRVIESGGDQLEGGWEHFA